MNRRVLALARATFLEALRDRVLLVVVLFALVGWWSSVASTTWSREPRGSQCIT